VWPRAAEAGSGHARSWLDGIFRAAERTRTRQGGRAVAGRAKHAPPTLVQLTIFGCSLTNGRYQRPKDEAAFDLNASWDLK